MYIFCRYTGRLKIVWAKLDGRQIFGENRTSDKKNGRFLARPYKRPPVIGTSIILNYYNLLVIMVVLVEVELW